MKEVLGPLFICICGPIYLVLRAVCDLNGPLKGPKAYDLLIAFGLILGGAFWLVHRLT